MKWTDRIRQVKIALVITAMLIAVVSLVVSHALTKDLEEQERIVGILDRFDALVNSQTDGLAAEIAARRQQYEYYRDKLLTF